MCTMRQNWDYRHKVDAHAMGRIKACKSHSNYPHNGDCWPTHRKYCMCVHTAAHLWSIGTICATDNIYYRQIIHAPEFFWKPYSYIDTCKCKIQIQHLLHHCTPPCTSPLVFRRGIYCTRNQEITLTQVGNKQCGSVNNNVAMLLWLHFHHDNRHISVPKSE